MRKLVTSCEYGELSDDLIRDRLVIGLKHNGDKVPLLREKNLDLKKAIQMCTTSEVATQQMKKIQSAEDNMSGVRENLQQVWEKESLLVCVPNNEENKLV